MSVVVRYNFQSNGACLDTCSDSYAFAVLQGPSCWCSNFAPGYLVNTLRCNDPCPGYPSDWCGSLSSGLYAYFPLSQAPSGTAARSSSQASRTGESSVSGLLTTESPNLSAFSGSLQPSPTFPQVDASPSTLPALTVITTQTIAPAPSEQSTVTVTEQAPSLSPSSSV